MIALGYITAALTLVLIVITGIYASANWRTMRLMEADLRFRTQPIPNAKITVMVLHPTNRLRLEMEIQTASAPLRIEMIYARMTFTQGSTLAPLFMPLRGKYLSVGGTATAHDFFEPKQGALTKSELIVTYSDLAGLFKYQTIFTADGQVTTTAHPIIATPGILNATWSKIIAAVQAIQKLDAQ